MKKYHQWKYHIMFPSARGLEWLKNKRIGLGKYFSFYGCLNTLKGKGVVSGSFTINLYISPLRIGMFNVHVPLMGYIVCLMMYGDDIEWREYPHCCSQIPERALTKCPVDPIIVPAQIWFEMNVEFVWSNSKMFVLLVSNILICRQLTRQCATIDRPRIRQTLANRQTFDQN